MSDIRIASISVEYIRLRVIVKENGLLVNPTSNVVEFGFTDKNVVTPAPEDWYVGSWETEGSKYFARVLVGPGTDVDFLMRGKTYNVWMKVYDDPATPVHCAGRVFIY